MIRCISGTVTAISDHDITIDIGTLSFALHVPNPTQFQLQHAVALQVHMHWNQEQGPTLYGFMHELERTIFLLITSCSGLGPKIALAVLGQLGPERFIQAIQTGNEKALSHVSGIGGKKAEQMIAQLRHKVAKLVKSGLPLENNTGTAQLTQWDDVAEALVSLNYTRTEIASTMKYLGDTYAGTSLPFDQLMRQALSFLSKKT